MYICDRILLGISQGFATVLIRDDLLLTRYILRVPAQEVASHRPDQTRKVAAWLFHGGLQFEGIVLNELVNASSLEKYEHRAQQMVVASGRQS